MGLLHYKILLMQAFEPTLKSKSQQTYMHLDSMAYCACMKEANRREGSPRGRKEGETAPPQASLSPRGAGWLDHNMQED